MYTEIEGKKVDLIFPGMLVVIDSVRPGWRGTGRPIPGQFWDDSGDPILDSTHDGCSVYHPIPGRTDHGRLISHDDASNWEVVE